MPGRADEFEVTTPTPDAGALVAGRRAKRTLAVEAEILPLLRSILQPGARTDDLLLRTGLLALGKLASTESDVALIVHHLTAQGGSTAVREAAALGAGFLRRSDPARRLAPATLDALRDALLRTSEDGAVPNAVRATSAIAVGLLGDQPFGSGIHRDGRLVVQRIWRGLAERGANVDLNVARLTALGMQPADGVPDGVREELQRAVFGRATLGRSWDDVERGHALCALARLGGPQAAILPAKVLQVPRLDAAIRRAAVLAVGLAASQMPREERADATAMLHETLPRVHDSLTKGLAWITVGRLVQAQLDAGEPWTKELDALWRRLLAETRAGDTVTRGFAALALGLAGRSSEETAGPRRNRVRDEAERLLLEGFTGDRTDPDLRGAFAVGLGLLGARSAVPPLLATVEDRGAVESLRADAAIALGQLGHGSPEVVRALQVAVAERTRPRVQGGAALALSMLRGRAAGKQLLREFEHASSTTDVLRLTEPLGHLGDPALARSLVEYVSETSNPDFPRALVIVALGNLGDPEPRPSIAWLGRDAFYPDAPPALRDALFTR